MCPFQVTKRAAIFNLGQRPHDNFSQKTKHIENGKSKMIIKMENGRRSRAVRGRRYKKNAGTSEPKRECQAFIVHHGINYIGSLRKIGVSAAGNPEQVKITHGRCSRPKVAHGTLRNGAGLKGAVRFVRIDFRAKQRPSSPQGHCLQHEGSTSSSIACRRERNPIHLRLSFPSSKRSLAKQARVGFATTSTEA